MKRMVVVASGLVVAAVAAYLAFSGGNGATARNGAPSDAPAGVAAQGKVEAMPGYDVDIGSGELNAKIARILVAEGERVVAGQVVAVLENEDLKAAVRRAQSEQRVAESKLAEARAGARPEELREGQAAVDAARAGLQEAQAQLDRYRALRAQGMVAAAALDEKQRVRDIARAAVEQSEQRLLLLRSGTRAETLRWYEEQVRLAQAATEHARRLLDRTVLRSPIAGTVIQRYRDEGEGVTPELPILAIADLDRLWINVEVDETDIGRVHVGDPAIVTSDAYRGRAFRGKVQQVGDYAGGRQTRPSNPAVNLGLKVVQTKIVLDEKSPLRLGMTVDTKITPLQ